MVVTPVRQNSSGGTGSALISQIGGLAGLNLNGGSAEAQTAEAVLESRHLVEEFIRRNELLPQFNRNPTKPPTLWSAVREFRETVLTIRNDTRKGVTIIAIEWKDPVTAARWANQFVALGNEIIRVRALDESNRNIAYMNKQLEQTNVLELRHVMYNIIENETKTLMLANGRLEYAFQVVDPAVPAETRVRPKRTMLVAIGLAIGLVLGFGVAFSISQFRAPAPGAERL